MIYPIKSSSLSLTHQMWAFQQPFIISKIEARDQNPCSMWQQYKTNLCILLSSSDFTDHKHGKAYNDERNHKRHESFGDEVVREKPINCRVVIDGPRLHVVAEEAQGVTLVALPCRVHQYMLQFASWRVKCRGAQIRELDKRRGKRECTSRINKPNYGSKDHSITYPRCRADLVPHVFEGHPPHAISHSFSTAKCWGQPGLLSLYGANLVCSPPVRQ